MVRCPLRSDIRKIGTIQRRLAWPLHKDDTLFQSGRPSGLNIFFMFPPLFVRDLSARRRAANFPARATTQCMLNVSTLIYRSSIACRKRGSEGNLDWSLPARPAVCLLIAVFCARLVAAGNRRNGSTISNKTWWGCSTASVETNSHFGIKIVIWGD